MTLVDMFQSATIRYPDNQVMVCKTAHLQYHTAYQRACQLSWYLRQKGVQPGERVVLLLKNSPTYLIAHFGVLGAGAIVVPLHPGATTYELQHLLRDSSATGVICHASTLSVLQPLLAQLAGLKFVLTDADMSPIWSQSSVDIGSLTAGMEGTARCDHFPWSGKADDIAQIIYTSGTTGRPKGITLTHSNLLANTHSIVTYLKLTNHDRVLVILPFFYSYGNSLMLTHVCVGGTLVIADQFVYLNTIVELMVRERVTGFAGVPSSYAMLLRQSSFPLTPFAALRYITCAGGALAKSYIEELRACVPQAEIYIMYGQTEASARLSYLEPAELSRKLGSIGRGMPGVVLQVLNEAGIEVLPGEVGEIVATGENVMQGYWNNPTATAHVLRDGKLYTGDLATVDAEGFIYIVGRKSDLIKSGSYRLHPEEVEEVLNAHPAVIESGVTGVEDEVLGESIAACVMVREECVLSQAELLQFAKGFLPAYKMPKKVMFVAQLPKTSSGKIRRAVLRQQWEETA